MRVREANTRILRAMPQLGIDAMPIGRLAPASTHQRIPQTAENRTLHRARALSNRLSDAEWDVLSQWQPRRKVHPGIRAQTGTQFPDDAASGKRIPEFKLGMGCIFRMAPQAETATQNRAAEWDALSQWQPRRKVHPGIAPQNGTYFPPAAPSSSTPKPVRSPSQNWVEEGQNETAGGQYDCRR